MRTYLPITLALLSACNHPITHQVLVPTTRKVIFQPPPYPVPPPPNGQPGSYPTVVGLDIDDTGQVTQVIPQTGTEPFLSTTIAYAKQWRFTPGLPTQPNSPVFLSITYTWGPRKTVDISYKL